jgi:hypothetical protein
MVPTTLQLAVLMRSSTFLVLCGVYTQCQPATTSKGVFAQAARIGIVVLQPREKFEQPQN